MVRLGDEQLERLYGILRELPVTGAAAERRGAVDFTPLWSGQAAPLGRAMPARTLTVTLVQEALERFSELYRPTREAPGLPHPPHLTARTPESGFP